MTVKADETVNITIANKNIPLRPTPRSKDGALFHTVRPKNGKFTPYGVTIPALAKNLPSKVKVLDTEVTLSKDPADPTKVRGVAPVTVVDNGTENVRTFRITLKQKRDGNWNLTSTITRKPGRAPVSLDDL